MAYGLYRSIRKKKILISFDYEHDRDYRNLLSALIAHPDPALSFDDLTPSEIQSYDVGRIKAVLTNRLHDAYATLVIIGKHANESHPDQAKIGTRNWQWWEIEQTISLGKKLIAVKIHSDNETPPPLQGAGAKWAYSFNVPAIVKAVGEA